ncbi:MAG: hypothetical protein AAGG56_06975 [Pseudomonadota bacterium]
MFLRPWLWLGYALAALISCVAPGSLHAEPAVLRAQGQDAWTTDLTWWVFTPLSTTGTSTVDGQSADIDMDLGEALEVLYFTSSLRLEAWRGDIGLLLDASYLSLSEEGGTTLGGGPFARDLDAEIEAQQSWVSLMAGYRFLRSQTTSGNEIAADLHGGLRYNRIHQSLEFTGSGGDVDLGGTKTWWEPVVGARGMVEINPNWTFAAGADFAGFGVDGNDLAWSATAAFDWSFSERASLKLGYRYYSIDYETGSGSDAFGWDIEQHGPLIGLTYAFK